MEKRKITAREVLRDIRSGLSDQDLMEKYTLSAQGLQSVFHKLVNAGVITQAELDDRVPISERNSGPRALYLSRMRQHSRERIHHLSSLRLHGPGKGQSCSKMNEQG